MLFSQRRLTVLVLLLLGGSGCSGGSSATVDAAPHADASDDGGAADAADGDGPPVADAGPDAAVGSLRRVFSDDYGPDVSYAPFGGSVGGPVIDPAQHHSGNAALRIDVPASGYTGGAFKVGADEDLSGFDAITFWARASKNASINAAGFGNGGAYQVERNQIALTGDWTHYVIPVPLAAKLTAERALFHIAEGAEEGIYSIWLDDVQFEKLPVGTIESSTPSIATESVSKLVGDSAPLNGASVTYKIAGADQGQAISRDYFTFTSSAPEVASVDAHGVVTALAIGSAEITAKLGTVDAVGKLTLTVQAVTAPDTGPTAPTEPATDVISLFSDAYTSAPVDTFRTDWSHAQVADVTLGADHVKKYSALEYVGIEFYVTASINATAMTHFHLDVWTPDATTLGVKLVDFGANGIYQGPTNDDSEFQVNFDATSTPALTSGQWLSLDIPLASFTGLAARAHLAQLILVGSVSTLYVDNVYFYKAAVSSTPDAGPPPTPDAGVPDASPAPDAP